MPLNKLASVSGSLLHEVSVKGHVWFLLQLQITLLTHLGDLDPECSEHIDALFTFAEMYANAPEKFVLRNDRPEVLRAGILGRYPPIKTASELVSTLSKK